MAILNIIGKVQVALGDVKIVAANGTVRDAVVGDVLYEGEQIVSSDSEALFQVKYTALPEATSYSGVFKVLADGSVVAGADESENVLEEDVDIFETAAGEEGVEGSSGNYEPAPEAIDYMQTHAKSYNPTSYPMGDPNTDKGEFDGINDQPRVEDIVLGGEDNPLYESHDGEDIFGEDDTQDDVFSLFRGTMSVADDNTGDSHLFDVKDTDETNFTSLFDTTAKGYNMHVDTFVIDDDGLADGVVDAPVSVVIESTYLDASLIDVTKIELLNNDAADRSVDFVLEGDFNALGAGETATVTFTYTATDDNIKNFEPNESEPRTVTMTVTGTNDQPIVDNIVIYATETHDALNLCDNWTQQFPFFHYDRDHNPTNDEYSNKIFGKMVASDDDVNDNHIFGLVDMTLPEGIGDDRPYEMSVNGYNSDQELIEVRYDVNGFDEGGRGTVDVLFESSDVDAKDISLNKIFFWDNDGKDSETTFSLRGDFDALGAGKTATITFKYYADDGTNDSHGETSQSEYKLVTITVVGTNDQPVIEDVSYETDEALGMGLTIFDGQLADVMDDDVNDEHTYEVRGDVVVTSGDVSGLTASVDIDPNTGEFTMTGDFNELAVGESATVTFDYVAVDNSAYQSPGESNTSEPRTVTLTVFGTNDIPVAMADDITKIADHIPGYDSVTAKTFWNFCFIKIPLGFNENTNAEVVELNNGSYAVNDTNLVWKKFGKNWREVEDGDKEQFIDSKGKFNEGLVFTFEDDVDTATIGVGNVDTNDNIWINLYNANGNIVGMMYPDLHSGHSEIVIDGGISFRSVGIFALDTWGCGSPETEFRVTSIESIDSPARDTVLDFVIDDDMLLDNDTDIDGDELEVQLTGDTNVYLGTDVVGSVAINGDGDVQVTMNETPETYEDGATLTFSYVVSDGMATSDPAVATVNVQHGDVDGTDVSYDQTTGEFIIGTDLGNEALPSNTLTVDNTLDLSAVSAINTIQLEDGGATVTGSSDLGHINPSDVMGATDSDNTLVIQSSDGVAADQVDVHESFGDAVIVGDSGSGYYAQYTDGIATLLVQIDEPVDVMPS